MISIKYLFNIIRGITFDKLKECIDHSHELSGKSKARIFFDMVYCSFRYGSGYYDYMMYGFFDPKVKRDTYLTRLRNKKLINYMNDYTDNEDLRDSIDNKNEFAKMFKKYFKREIIDGRVATYEEFEKFINDKDACFAKPEFGDSGRGVEKLYKKDFDTIKGMYDYIMSKGNCIIEECIVQHEEMSRLYPDAVNCMRVVTDLLDDEVYVAYVVLKCGSGGGYCDNSGQGGLISAVDKETGIAEGIATDDLIQHHYEKHPDTGVKFDGFKIPLYEDAINMCKDAAKVVPEIRHIGWDVAISNDGPLLIEGNNYPGTDLCQLYYNTPDGIGLMPFYRKYFPEIKF